MRKAMLVLAVFGLASLLYAADPFIGAWKLNAAKSKVGDPRIMPKSETITFTEQQGAIKSFADGVDAQGKAYHGAESVGKWDAKDVPVADDPIADMVATKKVNANTVEIVFKKAGKEVQRWRITISKDGKEMTSEGKWKDAKGQEFRGTFVYDKQ